MVGDSATIEEIEAFLNEFKAKARVWGIIYNNDKEENLQTLLELELFGNKRDKCLLSLRPKDYYQGPLPNLYDPYEGDVWIFGIGIKKHGERFKVPIYIKIYITGKSDNPNYCISFHIAKFEMIFPYKDEL